MEERFKLIKVYQGSPKLGTIIDNNSGFIYSIKPQEWPEFWEKIVELDYEILSFTGKITKTLYAKDANGDFLNLSFLTPLSLQQCLTNPYDIHSIKRLSNDEIFTVGDTTSRGIITEIGLNDTNTVFGIKTDLHPSWNGSETFKKVKEVKKVEKKEYEVISYKFHTGEVYRRTNHDTYTCTGNSSYAKEMRESIFKDVYEDEVEIYSVKRLSDMEIFTVGGVVDSKTISCKKILNIKVSLTYNLIFEIEDSVNKRIPLKNAKKTKKTFVITQGITQGLVRVYEGNSCWHVNKYGFVGAYLVHSRSNDMQGELKFFSTEKEARDYSEVNFPRHLITTEDGVKIYKGDNYVTVSKNSFTVIEKNIAKSDTSYYKTGGAIENCYYFFKDVEKAVSFRTENLLFSKKCLSIDDIAKIYTSAKCLKSNGKFFEQAMELQELVKSRL